MSMELDNSFTVPVPPEAAWDVLLDVARIAPCMPGATVDAVDGDVVSGQIKVKVGPMSLTYRGTATFTERDENGRTATVQAAGKDTRGSSTASATIKASLEPTGDNATQVSMHTTMNVTGRPAQFGRGVMTEVAGKLVDTFAANLAVQLAGNISSPPPPAAAGPADAAGAAERPDGAGDGEAAADVTTDAGVAGGGAEVAASPAQASEGSLNLVRLAGPAILKRVLPVAAVAAAVAVIGRRIMRTLRRGKGK